MFGGTGIYSDDLMFALVAGGEIFLKADDATTHEFKRAGSRPFACERAGRLTETSSWKLPDDAIEDAERLTRWARLAHAAAVRANAKKR